MKVNELGPETMSAWVRQMRVLDNKAWTLFMAQYVPNMERFAIQAGVNPGDVEEIISRVTKRLCEEFARKIGREYLPFRNYLAETIRDEIQKYRYETRRFQGRKAWLIVKEWWRLWAFDQLPRELEAFIELTTEDVSAKAEYIRELYKFIKERVEPSTFDTYYRFAVKGETYAVIAQETATHEPALRMRVLRVRRLIDEFNQTKLGAALVEQIQGEPIHIDRFEGWDI